MAGKRAGRNRLAVLASSSTDSEEFSQIRDRRAPPAQPLEDELPSWESLVGIDSRWTDHDLNARLMREVRFVDKPSLPTVEPPRQPWWGRWMRSLLRRKA